MTRAVAGVLFLALSSITPACSSEAPPGEDDADADAGDGFEDAADAASSSPDASVTPDPCEGVAPACPSAAGLVEGDGLVPIDRCAFPLETRAQQKEYEPILDVLATQLEVVSVAEVLGDLNRSATTVASVPGNPAGLEQAFTWQSGDQSVAYWTPQGITGSGNAVDGGRIAGRNVVLASWYYAQDKDPGSTQKKGVRIAVTDVTDPANVDYRFVLLVEPAKIDGRESFKAVNVHAGGLAWFGRYLYVVHTGVGLRVFDLDRMMKVSTGKDILGRDAETGEFYAHNYAYVLPQVETFASASECTPRFSFVSLDRTTEPPSLLSGEYDSGSIGGRLYRWPLDAATSLPALVGDGRLIADEAYFAAHSHMQGALSVDDTYWLSSSKPAAGAGVLYRTAPGTPTANVSWNDSPEDLGYDPIDDSVWSLSEALGARYVFRVSRTAID